MEATGPIRIQKYLSDRGICSRRQAEAWIADGQVEVNGRIAQLGDRIDPVRDKILLRGHPLPDANIPKVTLMMNKPVGVISSNRDPHNSQTVFDLLPPHYRKLHLYCAGRLDKDSEGLLILTNDGELAQRLSHPSGQVVKRYHVLLHRPFNPEIIPKLLRGVESEGEHLQARKVIPASRGPDHERRVEVHLDQGRKREIRRLFENFGYYVKRLRRYQIGGLILRKLAPGAVRQLSAKDIDLIFKA